MTWRSACNVKNDVLTFRTELEKRDTGSRSQRFFKCSKNFPNFTGEHLCWSLFKKVAGLKLCNIVKTRLQHRCFPVKFAKSLRTPLFTEHLWWRLLVIISLTPDSLAWVNRRFRLNVSLLKQPIIYSFIDDKNIETLIKKFFTLSLCELKRPKRILRIVVA